jgi:HEPN domain-containing protein
MQPDPVLVEDTQAWFRKVALDLRSAEVAFAADPPVLEDVVFHCQQAAEKAIKGFLTWHQREFAKTHDLRLLGRICCEIDPDLGELMERVMPLTSYAWKYRYPGESEPPGIEEAREAQALAREVASALLRRLPKDVDPGLATSGASPS